MRILVTGASGTVGGLVLAELAATAEQDGHSLRVLARRPDSVQATAGVEVVQGDLTSAEDVRRALDGVQRAYLTMADDNGAVFAEEAGRAGVEHVALLSSFTATTPLPPEGNNVVGARHRAGEQALTDAGVGATFLQAAGFDYNFLLWAHGDVVRAPNFDLPLPIVDPADIAASAVAALRTERPASRAYSITGPELLSVRDQATIAADVRGRPYTLEQNSAEEANAVIFPDGTPQLLKDSILATMMSKEATVLPVSGDVELLTGRPARTFEQWVRDHLDQLR